MINDTNDTFLPGQKADGGWRMVDGGWWLADGENHEPVKSLNLTLTKAGTFSLGVTVPRCKLL